MIYNYSVSLFILYGYFYFPHFYGRKTAVEAFADVLSFPCG